MTDVKLHDILASFEAARQSERPSGLTASGLHPICSRQTAYDLQGVPKTDDEPAVSAATVGTMLHAWYEDYWRTTDPGAMVEVRGAHGQPDVYRPDVPELRDLKTVNRYKFDAWAAQNGPPEDVWDQLAIYGYDVDLADDADLVIDALCRETGRAATYVASYAREWGSNVVAELERVSANLSTINPGDAPVDGREGRGDYFCDRCPWRTACLGEAGEPYRGQYDEATVVEAAAEYERGSLMEKEGKDMKKRAKSVLAGITGRYGDYDVKWVERTVGESFREGYTMRFATVRRRG